MTYRQFYHHGEIGLKIENDGKVHYFPFLSLFHHGQVETSQDWLHRPITPWSIRNMQNSIVTNFIIVKYKLAF